MHKVGDSNSTVTAYLEDMAHTFDVLRNINNPKETMQFLIPYTNMVGDCSNIQ